MRTKHLVCMGCILILICLLGILPVTAADASSQDATYDPVLKTMTTRISESEISRTVSDLQNIPTRVYPSSGNRKSAEYLYGRLSSIPGLSVSYQGGDYRNVIATLPGTGAASGDVIVGAHYDAYSDDPEDAPGATDNGAGVAIVLELARVMSGHQFDRTVRFAFWNAEEQGMLGSAAYVADVSADGASIPLYLNFDSAAYDPSGKNVLDIMYNSRSGPLAEQMTQLNSLYGTGLDLTYNEFDCGSDHRSFWKGGYPAIMTHSPSHAALSHTGDDTVDLISTSFAKKNAQLGLLLLAANADEPGQQNKQADTTPSATDAPPSPPNVVSTPMAEPGGTTGFASVPATAPHGSAVKFTVTPAGGKTIASAWWSFDAVNHLNTWNSRAVNPTFFFPTTGTFSPLVKITYTDGSTETVRQDGSVTAT